MAKILIADDEESIRHFLGKLVRMIGHEPIEASDGQEALEMFKKGTVDLTIVDINMPEMNGIKFLHAAKEIDPKSVIIIMTGYPSAETIIETVEDDGYTYIAKPIDREHLVDLIERGLKARSERAESS